MVYRNNAVKFAAAVHLEQLGWKNIMSPGQFSQLVFNKLKASTTLKMYKK